ncbi:hypothetical protein [Pantoea dispersa]|uniref:hypothetical protein n=1 Tax=Pantoea dispersa TaxID=59814 RepID=UPI0024AFD2F2|nr:hypothetical protein [Pantoea dispersa]MDI6635361.1 hypothetical protein [Pantoea dispersa]
MKPTAYLEDVTFDFEESADSLGAHIALTFDFQGGAASGYNKPLLFKSRKKEEKEQVINKLKEIGVDVSEVEEAKPVINKSLSRLEVYKKINQMADEIIRKQKIAPVKEESLTDKLIKKIKK